MTTNTQGSGFGRPSISPILAFWRRIFNGQRGFIGLASIDRNDGDQFASTFYAWPAAAVNAAHWLIEQAAAGRDVYQCAHLLTDKRRVKERAAKLTACYVDGDGAIVPPHLPQPTITVESSPGRHHYYWVLSRPVDPADGEAINKRLAYAMGADKSGWDLTQLTRPPGFPNVKYDDTPTVTIISDDGPTYDPDELLADLPPAPAETAHQRTTPDGESTGEADAPWWPGIDPELWRGEKPVYKDGAIDNSGLLWRIMCQADENGAPESLVAAICENRDRVLNINKYVKRPAMYRQQAKKVADPKRERPQAVTYIRRADPLDDEFVVGDKAGQGDSHAAFIDDDGFDRCDTAAGLREVIATQTARIDALADELAELRAVNKAMLAIIRSEAKPAAKVAAIELAIEAHTARPEDFTSLGGVAGRTALSDDSVSETCKAYRVDVPATALRAAPGPDDPPFRVTNEARMVNPWTGEVTNEPHIYTRLAPTHTRLSDTLAAIAANIPDELKKKPRADRGVKAPPAQIPDEQIPSCPEDLDAETVQYPEIVQVARCDDCGGVLAARTADGAILTPTTENIGSGKDDPHQQGCGLSYLYTDKSGRGEAVSQSRAEWVQERIEQDRVRRQLDAARLQDGAL
jgi:hypothetical protein